MGYIGPEKPPWEWSIKYVCMFTCGIFHWTGEETPAETQAVKSSDLWEKAKLKDRVFLSY